MTNIVRRFNKTVPLRAPVVRHSYGSEPCANALVQEQDALERDTERYVGQARQLIERERVREGER